MANKIIDSMESVIKWILKSQESKSGVVELFPSNPVDPSVLHNKA